MEIADITQFAEDELKASLGPGRVARVLVNEEPDEDGAPFLDIVVQAAEDRLPTARESIDAARVLRHGLRSRGELRFPNVVFVTAAEAA